MNRIFLVIGLVIWGCCTEEVLAEHTATSQHRIGTLDCKIVPGSGMNLLIHSTRDVRCIFTPSDGGKIERYKGETGIRLGIDFNINKRSKIVYAVLADDSATGLYKLAGKYTGVGGGITLGASVGDTTPIRNQHGNISLQPVQTDHSGIGAGAGFNYLYLEADRP